MDLSSKALASCVNFTFCEFTSLWYSSSEVVKSASPFVIGLSWSGVLNLELVVLPVPGRAVDPHQPHHLLILGPADEGVVRPMDRRDPRPVPHGLRKSSSPPPAPSGWGVLACESLKSITNSLYCDSPLASASVVAGSSVIVTSNRPHPSSVSLCTRLVYCQLWLLNPVIQQRLDVSVGGSDVSPASETRGQGRSGKTGKDEGVHARHATKTRRPGPSSGPAPHPPHIIEVCIQPPPRRRGAGMSGLDQAVIHRVDPVIGIPQCLHRVADRDIHRHPLGD